MSTSSNTALKYKYNDVEFEEALGLNMYEMDMRSYDPAIGRWTSIDPVIHWSMSTYTAFDNNPVYWADPSGADSDTFYSSDFMNQSGGHWSDSFNESEEENTSDIAEGIFEDTPDGGVSMNNFESGESYEYTEEEMTEFFGQNSGTQYKELPSFADLMKNYLTYNLTTMDVGNVIGGKVKQNIDSGTFTNTCAIRISHALNESGQNLPYINNQVSSSSSKKWYIFRVRILDTYMTNTYGPADIISTKKSSFMGNQGIIMFNIQWSDASGHFTLWNGNTTIGGSHNSDYYFKKSKETKLWKAK